MNIQPALTLNKKLFNNTVLLAALGYFVDIYDLMLFGIVRTPSLMALGYEGAEITSKGLFLLNIQMAGMLLGGIIWGICGDKKGRLKVLYGSILLYSIATLLNGFVNNLDQYAILRFIAGIGLAGELGAGVTLISETMTKEKRGYGTMLIATLGAFGAISAVLIAKNFSWQIAYFAGGGLGILLLLLRIGSYESGMFQKMKNETGGQNNFIKLFTNKKLLGKYFLCILGGIPIWVILGLLIILSPEMSIIIGVSKPVSAGAAILWVSVGMAIGDFAGGMLSQYFKNREKVIIVYILFSFIVICTYLYIRNIDQSTFYFLCALLGVSCGYWAVYVSMIAEQFGTNIRATVATTIPNFVRAMVIPITALYLFLSNEISIINAAMIVASLCIAASVLSLFLLRDTYGKDLDYLEK
ncbi:MAG: MFS transporter [Chitinophagales bacterium]|jgi:MFS family permease|nr:MFS transporter [Chitinophagales bacterium]MBP9189647.1 MFS transporter [Chitinophagales bacterium]MBP9796922.1 MFS transporter [Chitinophagales bacterium]